MSTNSDGSGLLGDLLEALLDILFGDQRFRRRLPSIILGFVIFLVFVIIVSIPLWYLHAAASVSTAPARVLTRAMDTDNIINSYEDFFDTYQAYEARVAQIHDFAEQKPVDKDDAEHLRVEVAGQRQSCREIVARYNSNSSKANHKFFKLGGGELPDRLDMGECNT